MKVVQGNPGEESIQKELQKLTELLERIQSRAAAPTVPSLPSPGPEPEAVPTLDQVEMKTAPTNEAIPTAATRTRATGRRETSVNDQLHDDLEPGEIVDVEMFTPEERDKIRRVLRVLPDEGFPLAAVTRRA